MVVVGSSSGGSSTKQKHKTFMLKSSPRCEPNTFKSYVDEMNHYSNNSQTVKECQPCSMLLFILQPIVW